MNLTKFEWEIFESLRIIEKAASIKYWRIIDQTKISNLMDKYSIKIEDKLSNEIINSAKEYWYENNDIYTISDWIKEMKRLHRVELNRAQATCLLK